MIEVDAEWRRLMKEAGVELDIGKRWEDGIPHHPESEKLANAIAKIDENHGGDYFDFQFGGDGDNGEHLMYLLDIYFEQRDEEKSNG